LARANAFLVTEPDRESWSAGELIRILIRDSTLNPQFPRQQTGI
jgi:hypothetical protein